MVANEFDPELLRMSPEEANEAILKLAQHLAQRSPEKVMTVDPEVDNPIDVALELQKRMDNRREEESPPPGFPDDLKEHW